MYPPLNQQKDLWSFGSLTFDTPVCTCRIRFTRRGGGFHAAYPATVYADGKAVGVGALSEKRGEVTACFPIARLEGRHEITVRTPSSLLLGISFDDQPPYEIEETVPIAEPSDLGAPFYEATDMLGRAVISAEETRGEKKRRVGMFYWTWRDEHAHFRTLPACRVLEEYPSAEYNSAHPAWGEGHFHPHWNEPLFGYYRNDDPYIIRRHAAMLAAAGVDFLLFDCTNGSLLWRDAYEALMEGLRLAMQDGIRVPKVAFMLNFGPCATTEWMLRALYQELYEPGRYRELWYLLDGKPMIMAYPESLPEKGVCEEDDALLRRIRSFFTFRRGQPLYAGGASKAYPESWGWLENYPQNRYLPREDGGCEMMTVGVAQNSSKHRLCTYFNDRDTFGRSYTDAHGHALLDRDSYRYGYNFAEQWERALALDPDIVFVTGWNEWIMGQYKEPWIIDPDSTQLAMVDQCDRERSRDIEPDKDGYLDTYYLRLCHYIRRYKGTRARPRASKPIEWKLNGPLSVWEQVTPDFRSERGTQAVRDWDGFAGYHYVNRSGRNNIIQAKVARDARYLWFYVRTADAICDPGGEGRMSLYLQTGSSSGWWGFDYLINRGAIGDGKTAVLRHSGGEGFSFDPIGTADVRIEGDVMILQIERALLGLDGEEIDFRFKWCDGNLLGDAPDLMSLYTDGDTAPLGRFCYRYLTKSREER